MTTDPPPSRSAWAAACPDAYPYDWYTALGLAALPPGFARFATDEEDAVIAGAVTPGEPRAATRPPTSAPSPTLPMNAGGRFGLLNRFVDGEIRGLTPGEVKVWLVLFRDTRDGVARTGQADIALRAGLSVRGVQKVIARLGGKGLLEVVRRGRLREGPSSYQVRLSGDSWTSP